MAGKGQGETSWKCTYCKQFQKRGARFCQSCGWAKQDVAEIMDAEWVAYGTEQGWHTGWEQPKSPRAQRPWSPRRRAQQDQSWGPAHGKGRGKQDKSKSQSNGKSAGKVPLLTDLPRAVEKPTIAMPKPAPASSVLKTAACAAEPLRFRGGVLAALYKGRGPHHICANNRSILLSNTLAKGWHSCLRDALVPYVRSGMLESQAGAVAGRGIDGVAMAVRASGWMACQRNMSAAWLFIDVKAAFYSVFRPLLFGHALDDEKLAWAMSFLDIPPVCMEWLRDLVSEQHVGSSIGVPEYLRFQVASTLEHSWFVTQGSIECGYSMAGTRPGDPLGDLLYVMLCSKVLSEVRDRSPGLGLASVDVAPEIDPCLSAPTWVDDSAFFQCDPSPESLLRRAKKLCGLVHDAFGKRGLVLNTSKGKSELLVMLRGPGARHVRQQCERQWQKGLQYAALDGAHWMPFTKTYKHMGGMIDFSLSLMPEIKARLKAAKAEVSQLRKSVFGNQAVSIQARSKLFQALVTSKLTFLVGTWRELQVQEAKAWRHGVAGLYRALLPESIRKDAAAWTLHRLCGHLCLPHPDTVISVARCQVYEHLSKAQDGCVRACIQGLSEPSSWTSALQRDLAWASRFCQLPSCMVELSGHFAWNEACAKLSVYMRRAVDVHTGRMSAGVGRCHVQRILAVEAPERTVALTCPLCKKTFPSKRQLATHANRLHQVSSIARFYAGFSCIRHACHTCFAHRGKLVQHLSQASAKCLTHIRENFMPMELEHVKHLDEEHGNMIKLSARSDA